MYKWLKSHLYSPEAAGNCMALASIIKYFITVCIVLSSLCVNSDIYTMQMLIFVSLSCVTELHISYHDLRLCRCSFLLRATIMFKRVCQIHCFFREFFFLCWTPSWYPTCTQHVQKVHNCCGTGRAMGLEVLCPAHYKMSCPGYMKCIEWMN